MDRPYVESTQFLFFFVIKKKLCRSRYGRIHIEFIYSAKYNNKNTSEYNSNECSNWTTGWIIRFSITILLWFFC